MIWFKVDEYACLCLKNQLVSAEVRHYDRGPLIGAFIKLLCLMCCVIFGLKS
jgi:hypothetical protein